MRKPGASESRARRSSSSDSPTRSRSVEVTAISRAVALLCGFLALAAFAGHAHAIQQPSPVSPDTLKNVSSAAERGDPNAQFALGVIYDAGNGVFQDPVEAVKWFRQAADKGHLDAQFRMGLAYAAGHGVAQNDADALEWFRKAGEKGHTRAQYMTGLAYFIGRGVDRVPLTGLDWLRKASEQGYAPAQFAVALSFHPGGDEIDASGSFQLLKRAAIQRHAPAQLALGLQLATEADIPVADPEKGPTRDLVEGYVWLDLCARHVETDEERQIAAWDAQSAYAVTTAACADARNQLRNKLTPEQTSEADGRVLAWMASFEKPSR